MNYRTIYSDNAVLADFSTEMASYYSGTKAFTFVAAEDFLYVGSLYPFNSLYLKLSVALVTGVVPTVNYWNGSSWQAPVELIDETKSLTQSGYLTWQINRFKTGWSREDTVNSGGTVRVAGLGGITIYDQYWIRISLASDCAFTLSWLGHMFISDNDLKTEHPELKNTALIGAIESGKTTWEEQIVRASKLVIEDLINRKVITNQSQILDRRKLESMTVSKTAEIIYGLLGDDYIDQKAAANKEYLRRVDQNILSIDMNQDGDLSLKESSFRQGYLYR